jgi:hypothetical protein
MARCTEVEFAGKKVKLFCVEPKEITDRTRKMVLIHGTERNAEELYEVATQYADNLNNIFIVPKFDLENFSYFFFNWGNIQESDTLYPKEKSLFEFLPSLNKLLYSDIPQYDLWGFSAGCQFVHRQLMFNPEGLDTVYCCAAGWYTMPTDKLLYPYGIGNFFDKAKLLANIKTPREINVFVGDMDVGEYNVKRNEFVDAFGTTRLDRAISYYNHISKLRKNTSLQIIPNIAHEDTRMLTESLNIILENTQDFCK